MAVAASHSKGSIDQLVFVAVGGQSLGSAPTDEAAPGRALTAAAQETW